MDIMAIGLNLGVIAGIIGLTEVVKRVVPVKLEGWVIVVPLVLGILAAMGLTQPLEWQGVVVNAIIYAGASTYAWKLGKTILVGK
jgi:hypothetical protein